MCLSLRSVYVAHLRPPQGLADMVGLMGDVNRNLQAMEDKSAARVQVGEAWLAFHDQVRRLRTHTYGMVFSLLAFVLTDMITGL